MRASQSLSGNRETQADVRHWHRLCATLPGGGPGRIASPVSRGVVRKASAPCTLTDAPARLSNSQGECLSIWPIVVV
jgi:hypothetical protein